MPSLPRGPSVLCFRRLVEERRRLLPCKSRRLSTSRRLLPQRRMRMAMFRVRIARSRCSSRRRLMASKCFRSVPTSTRTRRQKSTPESRRIVCACVDCPWLTTIELNALGPGREKSSSEGIALAVRSRALTLTAMNSACVFSLGGAFGVPVHQGRRSQPRAVPLEVRVGCLAGGGVPDADRCLDHPGPRRLVLAPAAVSSCGRWTLTANR